MAYTDIDKSIEHFNTAPYSGDGNSTQAITGVGFQPDWVWIKGRSSAVNHNLWDVIRGTSKYLITNSSGSENTDATLFNSFNSDGFTVGNGGIVNDNGQTYVGWCWKAGGTASSNSDGSITSSVSANTTSGFSIATWTGDGSKSATVGHGLGSELSCIIIKERTGSDWWHNWSSGLSGDSYNIFFNNNNAERSAYNDGHVKKLNNSTTFGFDSSTSNVDAVNQSGVDNVAYCFAEKKGFSKFGSYIGTAAALPNTPFVYTGFKPAFVLIKKRNGAANWIMFDNKRPGYNPIPFALFPNNSESEVNNGAYYGLDLLSNGFRIANTASYGDEYNANTTYVYMAFAENPFVTSTGIPGLAG
jgi:hypothetical protein